MLDGLLVQTLLIVIIFQERYRIVAWNIWVIQYTVVVDFIHQGIENVNMVMQKHDCLSQI